MSRNPKADAASPSPSAAWARLRRHGRGSSLASLVGGTALAGISLVLVGLLEYLFVVLMAGRLPTEEFGRLNVVLALIAALSAIATLGIGTAIARFLARPEAARRGVISSGLAAQLAVAILAAAILLLVALLGGQTRSLSDLRRLLVIAAAVFPLLALAWTLPLVFQGLQRIGLYAGTQLVNASLRIPAALLLTGTSATAATAFLGYPIAALATLLIFLLPLRTYCSRLGVDRELVSALWRFSLPVTASLAFVVLLLRADIPTAKFLGGGEGSTAAALVTPPALLTKTVFYLSSALAVPLLPRVAAADRLPARDLRWLFAGLTVLLISGLPLLVLLGPPLLELLFPTTLVRGTSLLVPLYVGFALLSLANIAATVETASGRPGIAASRLGLGFAAFLAVALVRGAEVSSAMESARVASLAVAVGGATSAIAFAPLFWRLRGRVDSPASDLSSPPSEGS